MIEMKDTQNRNKKDENKMNDMDNKKCLLKRDTFYSYFLAIC